MRTIALYRFGHFDPLRQRWVTARYVCEAPEIRQLPDDLLALSAAHLARVTSR